jgi:hypothetical protein
LARVTILIYWSHFNFYSSIIGSITAKNAIRCSTKVPLSLHRATEKLLLLTAGAFLETLHLFSYAPSGRPIP